MYIRWTGMDIHVDNPDQCRQSSKSCGILRYTGMVCAECDPQNNQ